MTLNKGQGQYNSHVMRYHVRGRPRAKLDDDDFNSFWGIACEGNTHKQTHMDLIDVNFFNVVRDFEKQKGQMQEILIKHPQPSLLQGGKTKEDQLTTYPMVK